MRERLYVSCIRNCQRDYMKVMEYILGRSKEVCDNTYYMEMKSPMNISLMDSVIDSIQANIYEKGVKSCVKNSNIDLHPVEFSQDELIGGGGIVYYIFYVLCNDFSDNTDFTKDDVVNLQYFSLVRQALENMENTQNIKMLLFIKPDLEKQSMYASEYNALFYKAAQFMSSATKKYVGCHYAYKNEKNRFFLSEMNIPYRGIWRKFSPLTELHDYKDLEMWSCALADLYKSEYLSILGKKGLDNIFKTIYYNGTENNTISIYEDKFFNKNNSYYRILKLCKAYFCEIPVVSGRKKNKNIRTKKEMTEELLNIFSVCSLTKKHS